MADCAPIEVTFDNGPALAALLAKMTADPSTGGRQDAQTTLLTSLATYLDGVEALIGLTNTALAATLKVAEKGIAYADKSIAAGMPVPALTANQAAGTDLILPANAARAGLKITPPADCTLSITLGAARGQTLIGGLTNTITGPDCPTNALYVSGLTVGATLVILEG